MKFTELRGRAVLEINSAKKIGEFEDILFDPDNLKPISIKVKTGLFNPAQFIPVSQLKGIGPDAVTFAGDPANMASGAQGDANLQTPMQASGILGDKVVTDTGSLVGEVHDLVIDPDSLSVQAYEVKPGGLFTRGHEIQTTPDVRHGDNLVIVPASSLREST